mmetsp:Transcript_114410/g.310717  ORF Transcript_114410/g.310717 Transcript_114410/m.310717 type:complete len:213 (+) Transcript_114410:1031-1669(+)
MSVPNMKTKEPTRYSLCSFIATVRPAFPVFTRALKGTRTLWSRHRPLPSCCSCCTICSDPTPTRHTPPLKNWQRTVSSDMWCPAVLSAITLAFLPRMLRITSGPGVAMLLQCSKASLTSLMLLSTFTICPLPFVPRRIFTARISLYFLESCLETWTDNTANMMEPTSKRRQPRMSGEGRPVASVGRIGARAGSSRPGQKNTVPDTNISDATM